MQRASVSRIFFSFLSLALCLSPAVVGAQAADPPTAQTRTVPDTMAQRMMACTVCHGAQGRATSSGYFPRIAGKPVDYLYNQLLHFRDGRRQNASMARLLDNLSDAYLRDMAEHFAGLDLPYPPPQPPTVSPDVLARGEALVRQGNVERNVPACVVCHGAALTGTLPATPGLLGLPRDYLSAQMGAWRTGLRHASAPDCMRQIAEHMSAEDVSAAASWLAAQALPANIAPAPASDQPPPLECGSHAQQRGPQ
jgi:cytochrome c553